jgi:HD-like signal output (HDOD) protein
MSQALTPEIQTEIRRLVELQGLSRTEAEKQVLGADHSEIGACLLKSWNIPDEIIEAVANHHQPVCKPRPKLSVITHVANCLAHVAGSAPGWDAYAVRVDPQAIAVLELDEARIEGLVVEVRTGFERVEQFMNLS